MLERKTRGARLQGATDAESYVQYNPSFRYRGKIQTVRGQLFVGLEAVIWRLKDRKWWRTSTLPPMPHARSYGLYIHGQDDETYGQSGHPPPSTHLRPRSQQEVEDKHLEV